MVSQAVKGRLCLRNIIEIADVSKKFGGTAVLEEINFEVKSGSITGLVGRNGAGKTTLLSIILGLIHPSSGEIRINGNLALDRVTNDVGFSINQGLFPSLTARQHLQLISKLTNQTIDIERLLKDVDLVSKPKQKVKNFSLGMQQRLRLAIAISGKHPILILDEPLNGLDPDGISWFRQRLLDLRSEGRTILLSSHLLLELTKVIDEVVILDKRVLWAGSIESAMRLSSDGSLEGFYKDIRVRE